MSIYAVMFYVLGAVIVAATALAITRRNLMHTIVYLALSFLGTALRLLEQPVQHLLAQVSFLATGR